MYEVIGKRLWKKTMYQASFTVEASMVLGVVFFAISMLIRHAFCLHDTVTGTMILSEILDEARYCSEEEVSLQDLEERGAALGNPRLWLGSYQVQVQEGSDGFAGAASAGEWEIRIDVKKSRPANVLRGIAAIEEIGGFFDDGGGIQEGNESELSDSETGVCTE